MAGIDEIISGVGGNTRYDFSTFGDPVKSFFDASKQRAEYDARRAFKDGVPVDESGQPDFGKIAATLFGKGDLAQGLAATKMGLEQQKLKYGLDAATADFPSGPGNPAPASAPRAPLVSPPSTNRSASATVAPPLNRGGEVNQGSPQGDQPGSIVGMVSGAGVPDELAGPIIAQVSALTRTDPNAAVNPQMAPRVAQIVQEVVKRNAAAGQPRPPAAAPMAPAAVPAAPAEGAAAPDPTMGGLVPAGRTPQQQLELLSRRVASGLLAPDVAKVYETRIKALQDAMQLTQDQKNAAASGKTLEAYQSRADEATAEREIVQKSILPKLDKSQEQATAARDDIQAIHRAREQLDAPGGIFSGAAADVRLKVAKVAEFLGVPNTDKITNTEAFGSAIGSRVLSLVKGLGAGAGISNADRDFAAGMAGGNIKLDESSIRRVLEIGERAARVKIDQHNALTDRAIKSTESLKGKDEIYKVQPPGQYQKPAAADPYAKARAAIAAGAPRDAVAARLKQSGFDPGKL